MSAGLAAVLDSNVVVALLAADHVHHAASRPLTALPWRPRYAVAAHSYAEAYVTLTRLGGGAPHAFTPAQAWAALGRVRGSTALLGVTPGQALDAVGGFAAAGGAGPRLYDHLIAATARLNGVPAIVTWNTRHMVGLFPDLAVLTPTEFAARPAPA